jgi:hypothetical protein
MKKIVAIITLFACTVFNISAQNYQPRTVDLKLAKNVTPRLRNTGIGFLCFGIATIAGGAVMVSSADGVTSYSNTNYSGTQGSFTGAMGALGIVGGSVSTLGGAIMTYFGQKKLNTSKRVQQNVTYNFTPFSGSIIYHF